jgi:cell division transport system permease protein
MFVSLLWFKEAFVGLYRNIWWNAVAFLMSLVCLLAFSMAFVAGHTADYFSSKLNERLEIQVNIKDKFTNYDEIKNKLLQDERVNEVTFVSKDEAQKQMIKEMGKDATVLQIFNGQNIFPAEFIVKVKDANKIQSVSQDIQKMQFADKVLYGKEYIDKLLSITSKVKTFGYYATIGGSIFVVFLVMWVIRMNIEQRKKEISIKQLIGSGNFTIRMPFVLEAIMLMAVSSLATFYLFTNLYKQFTTYLNRELPISNLALIDVHTVQHSLMMPLFLLALALGIFGSVFATSKHLKRI